MDALTVLPFTCPPPSDVSSSFCRKRRLSTSVSPLPLLYVAQNTYNYRKKSRPMQAFSLERATIHQNLLPIAPPRSHSVPAAAHAPRPPEILRPAAPPQLLPSRPQHLVLAAATCILPKPSLSGVRPRLQDPLSSAAAPPPQSVAAPDQTPLSANRHHEQSFPPSANMPFANFISHEGLLTTSRKPSRCITKAFSTYHEPFAASMIPFPSAQTSSTYSCHRASPSPTLPFACARRAPSSRLLAHAPQTSTVRFPFRVIVFSNERVPFPLPVSDGAPSSPFASISNVRQFSSCVFRQGYVRRWPRNILFRIQGIRTLRCWSYPILKSP
jgi:hypothetical protein